MGDTAIPFIYDEAGDFGCGLAPVRRNGYFGYINEKGNYEISPQFEYAEAFNDNRAFVIKNNTRFAIDKKGKRRFFLDKKYKTTVFVNGMMVLIYNNKKDRSYGLIDTSGRMILKPVWQEIKKVNNKYFSLTGAKGNNLFDGRRFVTTFKRYNGFYIFDGEEWGIYSYEDALLKNKFHFVVLDRDAKPVKDIVSGNSDLSPDYLGNGMFCLADMYTNEEEDIDSVKALYVINEKLDTVFTSRDWTGIMGFHNGVSLVSTKDGVYRLVDGGFNFITDSAYDDVPGLNFVETAYGPNAIVRNKTNAYGLLDATGGMTIPYYYEDLEYIDKERGLLKARIHSEAEKRHLAKWNEINKMRNEMRKRRADTTIYYFSDPRLNALEDSMHKHEPRASFLEGVVDGTNKVLVPFIYTDLAKTQYGKDVLHFEDTLGEGLVRTDGREVYRINTAQKHSVQLHRCNIAWMTQGFFFARSDEVDPKSMGWSGSENGVGRNSALPSFVPLVSNSIHVFVDTSSTDTVQNEFLAYSVYVINSGSDTAFLTAQDSRLHMRVQALDKKKKWRDIEYLPNSWCGNSYHALKLGPANNWKFTVPQYGGQTKTKLRIVLEDKGGRGMNRFIPAKKIINKVYYSNEFTGYLNPAQFFKKIERNGPRDIMDPYSE